MKTIVKIFEDVKIPGTDIILEAGEEIEVLKEDSLEAAKERMINWTVNLIRTGRGRRGPLTREEVKELLYFRYSATTKEEVLDEVLERAYEIVKKN